MVNLGAIATALLSAAPLAAADHTFIFRNRCRGPVNPQIVNTSCGYSPRCVKPGSGGVPSPAIPYNGPQPKTLGPGESTSLNVNRQWNGRIFHQTGSCGSKAESCTMAEFNLDTGNQWTPQAYDISNIQGFTNGMSIEVTNGETVTCSNVSCSCRQAYLPGDLTGCGNDSPVRGASAGDKTWTVTFCA